MLLFLIGFTFVVAGLYALGGIFATVGLACLVASGFWCYRIKPQEHQGPNASLEAKATSSAARAAIPAIDRARG